MLKKVIFVGVGIAMLASPLLVSAQTVNMSGNTSLIAVLTQLVQLLQQELQQLQANLSNSAPYPTGGPGIAPFPWSPSVPSIQNQTGWGIQCAPGFHVNPYNSQQCVADAPSANACGVQCSQGYHFNGDCNNVLCISDTIPTAPQCPNMGYGIQCASGFYSVPGGIDANGCTLAPHCVAAAPPSGNACNVDCIQGYHFTGDCSNVQCVPDSTQVTLVTCASGYHNNANNPQQCDLNDSGGGVNYTNVTCASGFYKDPNDSSKCDPLPAAPGGETGACIGNGKGTVAWNPVAGAAYYMLRFNDPRNDGPSCTYNGNSADNWYCPGTTDARIDNTAAASYTLPIVPNVTYYWWVLAVDQNGQLSPTSTVQPAYCPTSNGPLSS